MIKGDGSFFHADISSIETDKNEWRSQVETILNKIRSGKIKKAVLSRMLSFDLESFPAPETILLNLDSQLNTYRYFLSCGESAVAGASPEKLFSIQGQTIFSEAIAGSIQRGGNPAEDKINEQALLGDCKELEEHRLVTDFIVSALNKYCADILTDKNPSLRTMIRIMHLRTNISGTLKQDFSLEGILSDLFPTPATCGTPKAEAYELINELESHSRGLYSGALGWITNNRNAEYFVPLRLALFRTHKLHLFTGCGIVEQSDPILEYLESVYKAQSIANLLS